MGKKRGTQHPRRKYLPFRYRLWVRQGYRCPICTKQIRRRILYTDALNLDHIIPKSRGGTRDPNNLALVHLRCNQLKASSCYCSWYKGRIDRWKENPPCSPEVHNWQWPITSIEEAMDGED
ncbi:MAG: HNH endonuclease [Actinobacteria bacterium]|nr:HNH endonuclease [Actinomycetota bacterium]